MPKDNPFETTVDLHFLAGEKAYSEPKNFPNPCDALNYISEQSQDSKAIKEDIAGVVQTYIDRCKRYQELTGGVISPKEHKPDPSKSVATSNPDILPSGTDDSDLHQGGEFVPVQTDVVRPPPARADFLQPQDAIYNQYYPRKVDEVSPADASILIVTDDEYRKLIDSLRKNDPLPHEEHPTHSGQRTRAPVNDGDPVDVFSGRLRIIETDIDVPTAYLPLRLVRTYLSGRSYYGPWGFNWDHNYNVYLRELKDGSVAHWTGQLHESLFRNVGDGFEPDYGVHSRLEKLAPQNYKLTQPGGFELYFSYPEDWTNHERIPLAQIQDRHGNSQSLRYDEQDRLKNVSDGSGRGLHFEYGSCGLLRFVEDHTGTERTEYFHHPEIEQLVAVKTPPTSVYPDGATTRYEYDFLNDHPAMQHNILRVEDAEGQTYLQNEYGGPETGWAFNRVTQQLYGDFLYQFAYEQLQYVPENPVYVDVLAMRTVVYPPDGSLHTYTFNYRGDLIDYRFRLIRDGSYRVVDYQWQYDEQGNIKKATNPSGEIVFEYDYQNTDPCARGNLLKAERRPALPSSTESRTIFRANGYHSKFQLPLEIEDEEQNITKFSYDSTAPATGKLATVDLPKVTLPDGKPQQSIIRFETNSYGQVTAIISAENIRNEIHYVEDQQSVLGGFVKDTIQDVGGEAYKVEYDYDIRGRLKQITRPPTIVTQFSYNLMGQLEAITLPPVSGSVAHFGARFTKDGQPLRLERPRGQYTDSFISDQSIVDKFSLNVLGQIQQILVGTNTAKPRITKFCRDHEGRPVEIIDPMGARVRRCFDERGRLLQETVAAGTSEALTTRFTYEYDGSLRRIQLPDGEITEVVGRDVWQRPSRIRLPNGSVLTLIRDNPGRVLDIFVEGDPGHANPIGTLWRQRFEYDKRGRLIREKHHVFENDPTVAVELVTTYFYDADDRLRRIQLPRGGELRYEYDGLNRLTRAEDEFGNVESRLYDPSGNLQFLTCKEIEPGGVRTTVYQYDHDARGRCTKLTFPGGAEINFILDDRDLVVERHEPLNVVNHFRYGLLGELEEVLLDPNGLAIKSQYESDLVGRLKSYTDATGEVTQWERNSSGAITALTLPDGSVWRHIYNSKGQLSKRITPSGSAFFYTYQPSTGDLVSVETAPGPGVVGIPKHEFGYDGLGRLISASIPSQTVSRQYDSLGRMIDESTRGESIQAIYNDLAGTFDLIYPDGRREQTKTDLGGRPIEVSLVTPGALGGSAGTTLAKFVYAGIGRLDALAYGNGVTTSFVYDNALRLIRLDHTRSGQILESCRYRYDQRGRRRLMQLLGPPKINRMHQFDARDRLVQTSSDFTLVPLPDAMSQQQNDADIAVAEQASVTAKEKEIYWLNDADSREKYQREKGVSIVGTTYGYAPGHKATKVGSEILSYHLDGPREQDGDHRYEIDALGRVLRIRDVATSVVKAEFSYDPFSRLIGSQLNGSSFQRWFAGDRCLHEEDSGGGIRRQFTQSVLWPLPLQQRTVPGEFSSHVDGSFSSICVTDHVGTVSERVRFESFGVPLRFAADGVTLLPLGTSPSEFFYGGMPYLSELGLYHTSARLYHPQSGLFLARDRLLYVDSGSPYLFATHNPVDFVDPLGEDKKKPNTDIKESTSTQKQSAPWWMPGEAQGYAWGYYESSKYDFLPAVRGANVGSPLGNLIANAGLGFYNLYTMNVSIPYRILGKFDEVVKYSLKSIGFSDTEIEWLNYSMPMGAATSVPRVAASAPSLLSRLRKLASILQFRKSQYSNYRRALRQPLILWDPDRRLNQVYQGFNEQMQANLYRAETGAVSMGDTKIGGGKGLDDLLFHPRTRIKEETEYKSIAGEFDPADLATALSKLRYHQGFEAYQGSRRYGEGQAWTLIFNPKSPLQPALGRAILQGPAPKRTLVIMDAWGNLTVYDMEFWGMYMDIFD